MNKIETVYKLCQEVIEKIKKTGDYYYIYSIKFNIGYNSEYFNIEDHLKHYKVVGHRESVNYIKTKLNLKPILFGSCNYNNGSFESLLDLVGFYYDSVDKCEKHLNEESKNEQLHIIFENMNDILRCLNEILEIITITEDDFMKDFEEDLEIYKQISKKYNFHICTNQRFK